MPFRRRSCDACFSGRRKCDLAYPICGRCRQNKKTCNYVSSPDTTATTATDDSNSNSSSALDHRQPPSSTMSSLGIESWLLDDAAFEDAAFEMDLNDSSLLMTGLMEPNIPNMVGELGELQPVSGNTRSWNWVIEKLKEYPRDFVQHIETPFIHRNTCNKPGAEAIRAAFGICAACVCMNATNQPMLFEALNAEMTKLLQPATSGSSLREELAKMQAIVLYLIIRLFHGDAEQQAIVRQQQEHVSASMLHLLRRANVELSVVQPTWETWILAESARRTVMVAFMIYAVHSIFKHGVCPEQPTLSVLPVSTKQEFWTSETAYLLHSSEEKTVKYPEFTSMWLLSPPRTPHSFETMIMVACKGIEHVEALGLNS